VLDSYYYLNSTISLLVCISV